MSIFKVFKYGNCVNKPEVDLSLNRSPGYSFTMVKKEEERPLRTTVGTAARFRQLCSFWDKMSKNCSSQLFFTGPRLKGETLHEELHVTVCVIC